MRCGDFDRVNASRLNHPSIKAGKAKAMTATSDAIKATSNKG